MTYSLFKNVKVFISKSFKRNAVPVVMDTKKITTEKMQNIAKWTNLSEITFSLPANTSEADYPVRIFTPGRELRYEGHPTIGTSYALLESDLIMSL